MSFFFQTNVTRLDILLKLYIIIILQILLS